MTPDNPPPDTQQLQLFRAIRGAPATILLLLFVRGAAMTNLEICRYTGYTDKPVTAATGLLEQLGFLQYNGLRYGWSLKAGGQLPLPFGESYPQVEPSYPQAVDKMIGIFPNDRNISDHCPTTTTTIDTLHSLELKGSSSSKKSANDRNNSDHSQNGHEDRKNSDQDQTDAPPDQPECPVAYWLRRAGVGDKSRKYRQLITAGLDEYTVRAHAMERLADPNKISVGLFIRKLEDADPAPEPRCPDCFSKLDSFGMCPDYFCGRDEDED